MITIFTAQHERHAPEYEFFRGDRVPCFETPARADYVLKEISLRGYKLIEPTSDSRNILAEVHTSRYLDFLESAWAQWVAIDPANASIQPFPSTWPIRTLRSDKEPTDFTARLGMYSMDNGTPLVGGTWAAAKSGADAAVTAAELVSGGEHGVFCATRPPGHHAGADFMGGYCFLNNAAVATQALLTNGASRVAILDVDYHHGNGTQSIFYNRSDVLVANIHASPLTEYPFYLGHADEVGVGEGEGFNLNLPLPVPTTIEDWFSALEAACSRIERHKADALVVSLGLDTFAGDPISKFDLQTVDYSRLGSELSRLGLPSIFVLEGGYAVKELGVNAANVLDAFEGA